MDETNVVPFEDGTSAPLRAHAVTRTRAKTANVSPALIGKRGREPEEAGVQETVRAARDAGTGGEAAAGRETRRATKKIRVTVGATSSESQECTSAAAVAAAPETQHHVQPANAVATEQLRESLDDSGLLDEAFAIEHTQTVTATPDETHFHDASNGQIISNTGDTDPVNDNSADANVAAEPHHAGSTSHVKTQSGSTLEPGFVAAAVSAVASAAGAALAVVPATIDRLLAVATSDRIVRPGEVVRAAQPRRGVEDEDVEEGKGEEDFEEGKEEDAEATEEEDLARAELIDERAVPAAAPERRAQEEVVVEEEEGVVDARPQIHANNQRAVVVVADADNEAPIAFQQGEENDLSLDTHNTMLARQVAPEYYVMPGFMQQQRALRVHNRATLVDWLVEVQRTFGMFPETLFTAVRYLDRFLTLHNRVRQNQFQLLGATCMFLAAKIEELRVPEVADMVWICDNTYHRSAIIAMEHTLMVQLDFFLVPPTPYWFVANYQNRIIASSREICLSVYYATLTLQEHDFSVWAPSVIAASAIRLALLVNRSVDKWDACDFWRYSNATRELLEPCFVRLNTVATQAPHQPLNAVVQTFSDRAYMRVAQIPVPHFPNPFL